MAVSTYNTEFWRWYLVKHFNDFEGLSNHQHIINNYENIFSETGGFDLSLDLSAGTCIDSSGERHRLNEFVALKLDKPINEVEREIDIEFNRWEAKEEEKQKNLAYVRDIENYCWKKSTGQDSYSIVTHYDIILTSVIEKYNLKLDEWERYYEAILRYKKFGREMKKEIKLTPDETHSANDFSKAVWQKGELRTKNLNRNEEMHDFWVHVNEYYRPRVVREYEYYGFIEFEGEKFFLAENVLIRFPDRHDKPLQLIAKKDGAFPVEENKFVKPPEDAIHLPNFELGIAQNGMYQKSMGRLFNDDTFERQLARVEDHFCKMVGGDSDFRQWGKLIVAYIFSYIFFDDIYGRFNHIIFLYFYGDGNVGKGEVVKRILDFYGINYLDSLNTPPPRSVDEALEQKSQIPQWIDEHVPEVPGKEAKTKDQIWNSWFELKMRRTNMQKGGSWGAERKAVRTMPVFCSNFKPQSDHLLSRCIIIEYRKERRGPEKHVTWLKNNKELLQLLMLSYMQHYKLMDREAFIWDIERMRTKLKDEVKAELEQRSNNAILQDRQINQFATLMAVYHWLDKEYRTRITNLAHETTKMEAESDITHKNILKEQIDNQLTDMLDEGLYNFISHEIVKTAMVAAQHDPLTDYIESIGTLIQAHEITEAHFNWTEDGHLKIWAKAVWDIYQKAKRGADDMVRRQNVEEKLKELSDTSPDGTLKTINWTYHEGQRQRQKGFYIKGAVKHELFRNAFNMDKYGPLNSHIDTNVKTPDLDDELPF